MRITGAAGLLVLLVLAAVGSAAAAGGIAIAHRGASGYLPEHTLAAKAVAHAMGADYVEQDLVLSRDGVPVVLHDLHLDAVTDVAAVFPGRARADGRHYAIDFTVDELKRLRVTERIHPRTGRAVYPARFPPGASSFRIATFAEAIELVQGMNRSTGREVGIYPEIKAPAWHREQGHDISRTVLDVLRAYGYTGREDPVYLQTFDWNEARRLRLELGYEGRLVQLIGERGWGVAPGTDFRFLLSPAGVAAIAEVADGIGPWLPQVVAGVDARGRPRITDLVATAHAHGLEVHPYTLRADALPAWAGSLEDAMRVLFCEAGVDGIFTDFPDRAAAFLRRERQPCG